MVEKYKPDVPNNYDPNVDLISSLLSASSNSLLRAAVSAREALGGGLSRAMRLIEPPPEGKEHPYKHEIRYTDILWYQW